MASQLSGETTLKASLKKLYKLLVVDRKDIYVIYWLAILGGLVQLSLPLGIQSIINFVQAASFSVSLVVLIIMVMVGVFINGLMQVRQLQLIEKIEQKIFVRYSFEFAERLPRMNIQKMDDYYLPELVNRFFDTMSLQKGMSKLLLDIPGAFIQMIFGLILLSFYHPVFIVFGTVLFLLLITILRFTSPKGMETSLQASDYKYGVASWLEEMARTIKTFKYSKGTLLHMKKTDELTAGYLTSRTAHFKVLQGQYWSLISFKIIITAAMLIVGALLLVGQQINIGQFVAAEIVIISVIASAEKFILSLEKVYDVLTALQKLGKVTESAMETEGSLLLPEIKEGVDISFENVGFSYPGDNNVLQHISFHIPKGQHLAVVGKSGSGKSSLLRLLTGAFRDFQGNILIDDVPVGNYTLQSLRSQTGIILSTQDIFKASLKDNITMGNESVSIADIAELANLTGLAGFVQSQPEGYDFIIDPMGKRLSKKYIQAILLMRALLGKHRLLLLEEPCMHMDKEYMMQLLSYLKNDTTATIIITTNDPVIAASCDKVILLNEGKIKAVGNWKDIEQKMN